MPKKVPVIKRYKNELQFFELHELTLRCHEFSLTLHELTSTPSLLINFIRNASVACEFCGTNQFMNAIAFNWRSRQHEEQSDEVLQSARNK